MRSIILLLAAALAGCETAAPVTQKTAPPSARLMVDPKPLPDVAEGSDIYEHAAQCRAEYGRETAKLKGLQGYTRIILKPKI